MDLKFITSKDDAEKGETGLTIAQVKVLCQKLKIKDLESRPIYIDPSSFMKIPNNGIIIATSYPFGGNKCIRAMWMEYKVGYGYRTVTCTSHKSMFKFNANHNSTYNLGIGYFSIDDKDHFQGDIFRLNFYESSYHAEQDLKNGNNNNRDRIQNFLEEYQSRISENDIKLLNYYIKLMDSHNKKVLEVLNAG